MIPCGRLRIASKHERSDAAANAAGDSARCPWAEIYRSAPTEFAQSRRASRGHVE
jgi:hypothetical protein